MIYPFSGETWITLVILRCLQAVGDRFQLFGGFTEIIEFITRKISDEEIDG